MSKKNIRIQYDYMAKASDTIQRPLAFFLGTFFLIFTLFTLYLSFIMDSTVRQNGVIIFFLIISVLLYLMGFQMKDINRKIILYDDHLEFTSVFEGPLFHFPLRRIQYDSIRIIVYIKYRIQFRIYYKREPPSKHGIPQLVHLYGIDWDNLREIIAFLKRKHIKFEVLK